MARERLTNASVTIAIADEPAAAEPPSANRCTGKHWLGTD